MKTKLLRAISVMFCAAVLLSVSVNFAFAETETAGTKYINPDTGYKVVIIDELDLLSDDEEEMLAEDMESVTQFGNAAFWTTEQTASSEIEQARLKRRELFSLESATIFAINMNIRKLTIQSYGEIEKTINDSYARSITDNVKSYASRKNYYLCGKTAFEQIFTKLNGGYVPEPLKIAGYVVLSLMLGIIIALSIAFSSKFNPLIRRAERPVSMKMKTTGKVNMLANPQYIGSVTVHRPPRPVYHSYSSSCSSGSSCSSCSSGSSCSSCSSCSSGSSCSSCGSGGSSSF